MADTHVSTTLFSKQNISVIQYCSQSYMTAHNTFNLSKLCYIVYWCHSDTTAQCIDLWTEGNAAPQTYHYNLSMYGYEVDPVMRYNFIF